MIKELILEIIRFQAFNPQFDYKRLLKIDTKLYLTNFIQNVVNLLVKNNLFNLL